MPILKQLRLLLLPGFLKEVRGVERTAWALTEEADGAAGCFAPLLDLEARVDTQSILSDFTAESVKIRLRDRCIRCIYHAHRVSQLLNRFMLKALQ